MLFEDQTTKCPGCKGSLILLSHVERWEKPREVHEFDFRCDACKRNFTYKDDQLTSKTHRVIVQGISITRPGEQEKRFALLMPRMDGPLDQFL